MNRAERRYHKQRMVKRAFKSYKLSWIDKEQRQQAANRHGDNLSKCSCWMCGNPRHKMSEYKNRIPIGEQKRDIDYRQQVEEWRLNQEIHIQQEH